MGDHEGWAQPSGLLPGEAGIATRPLDRERWTAAEERTAQLIACIQPNRPSEERRTAVADYVQRLIQKCFNCEVFTYGSVPLKTYLPDGDIDLTAFSKHQNLKDTWANEVRVVLENEEKNENAEFRVKEVQYIQAEVKLIKCLVENIVVDISFNQVGGLCTLCFLEQVDNFIGQNHLFKRSIILIKAWCYYESRVLGAHHGLISTYALETLVLYIFHVFNTSLSGPLEVLYRFLAFFSNFDWENYCVSLWGPIPLKSLPEMAAEPPLRDGGKLLLDKPFLDACSTFYAVIPGGQESQGQTFISKHFNIVDPLRTTNNLGRSVSKGNFYRIRSAFGFGAKKLARILECPREKILSEIDQFFMNTWERHGSGQRPDASPVDTNRLQPSIHSSVTAGYVESNVNSRKDVEDNSGKTGELGELQVNIDDDGEKDTQRNQNASSTSTGLLGHPFEKRSSIKAVASLTTNGSKKAGYSRNSHQHPSAIVSDQLISRTNENASSPRNQKGPRPDTSAGDTEVKPVSHFSRAFSSPELTNVANDNSTRGRKNRGEISEAFKFQVASLRANQNPLDRRRRNLKSDNASYTSKSAASNESFDMKQNSSHDNIELENTCDSSNNSTDLTLTNDGQDKLAVQREGTHSEDVSETSSAVQDAQDSANVMGTSQTHFLNRHGPQIHFPVNFASLQLPVPVVPSLLAPVYAPSNLSGMLRTSFPMAEPSWGLSGQSASYTAVPFPQPHVPSPGIPNLGMVGHSQLDDTDVSENKGPIESDQEEMHREHDSRQQVEEHRNAFLGHASGNSKGMRSFRTVHEEPQPFNQERPLHRPFSPVKGQTKFAKDGKGQLPEGRVNSPHQPSSSKFDENGPTSKFESSTLKVTENNWMGGTGRVSKPYRDRRGKGRGTGNIEISNSKVRETENPNRSNSNSGWQSETDVEGPVNGDDASYQDSDCYSSLPHASKSPVLPSASVLTAVPRVQQSAVPLYDRSTVMSQESAMTSSSGSVMVGQGLRQRGMDNSGLPPFAFYPTGPPLPFFMFPLSYIPADGTSTGDLSTSYDNMGSADEPADNQAEHSDQGVSNSGYDMEENLEHSQNLCSRSMGSAEASCTDQVDDMKSDILRSDFDSHWLNLQYGRLCQNPRIPNHVIYPSPAVIPPLYLQGHFPWDGPGRPVNMSTITQLVSSYGQRFVPVMALQPNSTRTTNNFQRFNGQNRLYSEELPRYRGGTGTYLPNLRQAPYRDRHSSGSKGNRSNYGQDRNEHGDRDPSWYMFPRGKSAGRGQNRYDLRNQSDSSNSRGERVSEGKGGDRMWDSHRNENVRGSYQAQSVPFLPANAPGNSNNVGAHSSSAMSYGMYPMQSMNTFGNMPSLAANGPPVPSVVMLYPYDHNVNFTPEPLEFGSLGPVQLQGSQEGRLNDIMGDAGGRFDEGNYCEHDRSSYHLSNSSPGGSPVDHPSSPMQSQRSTRKSYQLKEEDFPPLSFRNQSRRGRSNSFNMENRPNSNSSSHYQSFMVGQ